MEEIVHKSFPYIDTLNNHDLRHCCHGALKKFIDKSRANLSALLWQSVIHAALNSWMWRNIYRFCGTCWRSTVKIWLIRKLHTLRTTLKCINLNTQASWLSNDALLYIFYCNLLLSYWSHIHGEERREEVDYRWLCCFFDIERSIDSGGIALSPCS